MKVMKVMKAKKAKACPVREVAAEAQPKLLVPRP